MANDIQANLMDLGAQAELDRIVRHIMSEAVANGRDGRAYTLFRNLVNDLIEGKHK